MDTANLQSQLFRIIKNSLPTHISLAERISEIFDISSDSAYRRIRGETPLTLSELKVLCETFQISLDQVLELENDVVVFHDAEINNDAVEFGDYLKGILGRMKYFNSFSEKKMLYLCKDAPIFHFYLFPELAAFKTFFWIKTIQNHPDYADRQFVYDEKIYGEYFRLGQEILEEYNLLPSVELWNFETLNSTVSQIKYYADAGIFASASDYDAVIGSFQKTVDHLQLQVSKGVKFKPGAGEAAYRSRFDFYINEVIIGNNTILLELAEEKLALVNYRVLSYMMTKDARFCKKAFSNFHTLQSRSTLISGIGERERNRFFKTIRDKVSALRHQSSVFLQA
jgi:hypothetical protein